MIVKRISYFTFMVAITTIATVSSCNRAKGKAMQSISFSENALGQAATLFFEGTPDDFSTSEGYSIELARVLREKGLKSGRFKITTHDNGHENVVSIYLIFDKDYKGHVSARIFDSKHHEYGSIPATVKSQAVKNLYADISFDEREGIAQKNRILLE